jgi:hypothetical protein
MALIFAVMHTFSSPKVTSWFLVTPACCCALLQNQLLAGAPGLTGIPGTPMGEGTLAGQQGSYGNAAGGLDYEGAGGRGGRGGRGARGAARGSGRGGRGGGRGGARRRRAEEDAFYTPPGTSIASELMRTGSGGPNGPGMGTVGGGLNSGLAGNLPHVANNAAAVAAGGAAGYGALDDRPMKRRRRTLSTGGGPDGRRWELCGWCLSESGLLSDSGLHWCVLEGEGV